VREVSRDQLTGVIVYMTKSELLNPGITGGSATNVCYQRFFVQTEIAFQLTDTAVLNNETNEQMTFFNRSFRPCLDHLGIPVPADLTVNDENWVRLLDLAADGIKSGKCPPELFSS
jgi:hypothetical protein